VAVAAIVLSIPLILEFVFGPLNLWREHTTANWIRFTGYSPNAAKRYAAPVKLACAVLLAAGLAWRTASIAGAVAACAVSAFYLVRLAAPSRRAGDGVAAFVLFGALAAGLLAVQLAR
jgi:hypothetical protein